MLLLKLLEVQFYSSVWNLHKKPKSDLNLAIDLTVEGCTTIVETTLKHKWSKRTSNEC